MRLVTLGVGAQNSPRYAPAGLLVATRDARVMLDGGPGAEPSGHVHAWLVTDDRAELIRDIRRLAARWSLEPNVAAFQREELRIRPKPVVHTNHPMVGYLIEERASKVVWAPEFQELPRWARRADLMFAEAAEWNRPIRFWGGVGGHLDATAVAREAQR